MYQIRYNGTEITSQNHPDYAMVEGVLDQQLNAADMLSFTLPPMHEAIASLAGRTGIVQVVQNGRVIFAGDIINTGKNFRNEVKFECQGALLWLNDVVIPKPQFSGTVASFWAWLIGKYNAECASERHITAGTCDITGTISIDIQDDFITVFDLVRNVIAEKGGYVFLEYSVDGTMSINYLAVKGRTTSQYIAFGENLLDLDDFIAEDGIFTRIYPIGNDGLDISSVNSGLTYLENEQTAAIYGAIGAVAQFDTDSASELKALGQATLDSGVLSQRSLTLTAFDLSVLGSDYDTIEIGDEAQVISAPHGIDTVMTVTEKKTNLVNISRSRLTLGKKLDKISSLVANGRTINTHSGGGIVQVQSDWAQTNTSAVDYIKNKPTIPTDVVKYTAQALTAAQQAQVRQNIGAGSATGVQKVMNVGPDAQGNVVLPNAAPTVLGVTKLVNDINSTATDAAGTAKIINDVHVEATRDASTAQKGRVQLYDGVDSDSITMAATARAVKLAYQHTGSVSVFAVGFVRTLVGDNYEYALQNTTHDDIVGAWLTGKFIYGVLRYDGFPDEVYLRLTDNEPYDNERVFIFEQAFSYNAPTSNIERLLLSVFSDDSVVADIDDIDIGGQADIDDELSSTSENPVQNKVITAALGDKVNTSDYNPTAKTTAMTQAVGRDDAGGLWTAPSAAPSAVSSVNGKTGNVTLEARDIYTDRHGETETFVITGESSEINMWLLKNGTMVTAEQFKSSLLSGNTIVVNVVDRSGDLHGISPVKYYLNGNDVRLAFTVNAGHSFSPALCVLQGQYMNLFSESQPAVIPSDYQDLPTSEIPLYTVEQYLDDLLRRIEALEGN